MSHATTTHGRNELAVLLAQMVDESSYRSVSKQTGISKGALVGIITGSTKYPDLDTVDRLAESLKKPAWRVLQMAGFDADLPEGRQAQLERITQMADKFPPLRDVLAKLESLNADQVKSVALYLDVLICQQAEKVAQLFPPPAR